MRKCALPILSDGRGGVLVDHIRAFFVHAVDMAARAAISIHNDIESTGAGMASMKTADRIDRLKEQARAKMAKAQRLEAQERERERKRETRRKIILGAIVSALMKEDESIDRLLMTRIAARDLPPRDREILGLEAIKEETPISVLAETAPAGDAKSDWS